VRPADVPVDYDVYLESAEHLVAADVGGKSDPYAVFYSGPYHEKKKKALTKKSSVQEKTLNPNWYSQYITEYQDRKKDDILTVELYDKDAVGSDDFLGMAQIKFGDVANQGKKTFTLTVRPGKKDKVSGTVTISVNECGSPQSTDLGFSLIEHYALQAFGKSDYDTRQGVRKLYSIYAKAAGVAGKPPLKPLNREGLQKFFAEVAQIAGLPFGKDPNAIEGIMRLYDDSGDAALDFHEIMSFISDSRNVHAGQRFVLAGLFAGLNDKADKKDLLGQILKAMIPKAEDRDPEALKVAIEAAVKKIYEDLDENKDGTVTGDEIRQYTLNSDHFGETLKALSNVPMKKA